MKKIPFILLALFFMPLFTYAQYYFSAQVSSDDPCCIAITAGSHSDDDELEDTWTVIVDGIYEYNYASDQNKFLHCVEGNGTHSVSFYVNGELYWTRNVEVTDCEGDCTVCDIKPMRASYFDFPDECQTFLDVDFLNLNGGTAYSEECTDPTFVWDFGDGNSSTSSSTFALHSYEADGTYVACVSFSVTNPDGELCTVSECIDVTVEGCDPDIEEPCCGFHMDGPSYMIAPWDPCLVRLTPGSYGYSGECSAFTFSWDIDGDGTVEHTGSSYITGFDGPGPHTVCLTMSYEDCEISDCVTFELPDCEESEVSDNGRPRSEEEWNEQVTPTELKVFPNPATDYLNIQLSENQWNPVEVIFLRDATGKLVEANRPGTDSQIRIDISGLSLGVYFVQVMGKEGLLATERFVKIR